MHTTQVLPTQDAKADDARYALALARTERVRHYIDIQNSINQFANELAYHNFSFFTHNALQRLVMKAEFKLYYQKQPIKKIQLFIRGYSAATETNASVFNSIEYCFELSLAKQKMIFSLPKAEGANLALSLRHAGANSDYVLVRANHRRIRNVAWDADYLTGGYTAAHIAYPEIRSLITKQLVDLVREKKITSVVLLEYGCGHGNLLASSVDACRQAGVLVHAAIGTDLSAPSVEKAKKKHLKGDNVKVFNFLQLDSLKLAASLGVEMKKHVKEHTHVIALSSGATNRLVLDHVSEAIGVLNNLYELSVNFIILSGHTELLCNNTVAKRGGYQVMATRSTSSDMSARSLLVLSQLSQDARMKYSQKFAVMEEAKSGLLPSEHQLATTPQLFKRLTTVLHYETTIQDEKGFAQFKHEIMKELYVAYVKNCILQRGVQAGLRQQQVEKYETFKRGEITTGTIDAFIRSTQFLLKQGYYCNAITLANIYRDGFRIKYIAGVRYSDYRRHYLVIKHHEGHDAKAEIDCFYTLLENGRIRFSQYCDMMHYLMNTYRSQPIPRLKSLSPLRDGLLLSSDKENDEILIYAAEQLNSAVKNQALFKVRYDEVHLYHGFDCARLSKLSRITALTGQPAVSSVSATLFAGTPSAMPGSAPAWTLDSHKSCSP